jgi:outer membrane lipoprotein SlyB
LSIETEDELDMKQRLILTGMIGLMLVSAGCYTPDGRPDRTAGGALTGGALGATAGAIIGSATGRAGAGALIGGALGAITGGIVGNAMDEQQREILAQQSPQTLRRVEQGQPLATADIKALSKAGVSDEVIISQIRASHTIYRLTTAEIIELKEAGVSERVIDTMINTPNTTSGTVSERTVAPEAPPPPPVETVVVAPSPGYVWVPGEWLWRGRWVWVSGRWAYPPRPHARWVHGGWVHHRHGYVWTSGCWRY